MNSKKYNNLGIAILSIMSVLQHCKRMQLSKIVLIMPIVANRELLSYLARANTVIFSIEKLTIDKIDCVSNFNDRYYDNLYLTLNAVQYLNDMNYVICKNGFVEILKEIKYDSAMGKRADKVFKASHNIEKVLNDDVTKLYLNFRIEL